MAEPICEDEGLLQEWTPQTHILQQIPLKTQRGLFPQNLNLTCLDVISEYIALGTNLGFVYWYCRVDNELQRLRLENSHCSITCVKVLTSVDYMVAAGTNQGTIIVFQIPKVVPCSTSDQAKPKQKKIERFTINGLHSAPISSIEWSQNELKVFSGDKNGVVVLTEIDFSLHISKSMELLNEQFEIVQLSFCQQILLISTVYRSIICDGSNNWKVHQVGTKERKILGKFGATFCNFQHGLVLFASRPGHRLWLSDKNGVVQQTLIFKSAVQSNCPKIQLINPVNKKEPYDTSFGKVIQFGENNLVTYNSEILYVLHPGAVSVVSVLSNARKILDLAVNKNEIFILEGERSLIRISPLPDKYTLDMMYQPISRRTSFNLDEFAAKIKDTAVESIKKITKDLIITPEQTSPNSPPALADEALELPPIVNLPSGSMPTIFASEDIEIHSSVPNTSTSCDLPIHCPSSSSNNGNNPFFQDCPEEVITRPLRKRHHKKAKHQPQGNEESMSDSISNQSEDRLVWGVANDMSLSDESAFSHSQSSFSVLRDISTLLNQQKPSTKTLERGNDEAMKTSDSKSQTSLDTCESVSELLQMTSEMFREEQEKTFARLANQSLLDSFNSERTDNMSISLNLTTSSSVSSKISENLHSPSYTSENSGAASRAKSTESQSTDNFQNEPMCSVKDWRSSSNILEENSQEDKVTVSSESSISSRYSQRERLYPRWSDDGEAENAESGLLERVENFSVVETESETINMKGSGCSQCDSPVQDVSVKNLPCTKHDSICSTQGSEIMDFSKLHSPGYSKPADCESEEPSSNEVEDKKETEFVADKTFDSVEPLSYGPPSGSSVLSSQPSSGFSSMPTTSQALQIQSRDSFDHWPQYKTPAEITSFAASKNYIVCTDINESVYYSNLLGFGLSWTLLDYKASLIKVSNDGSFVWMLNKNTIVALVDPSQESPISSTTIEIAENVKSFAIDCSTNYSWILTLNGKIFCYDRHQKKILEEEAYCDHIVVDIDCANGMILALTNDDKVLCKPSKNEKFRRINTLNLSTNCLALGPGNLLWVVDVANNIYFSDDFLNETPHWWQIQISDYIFQNSSRFLKKICSKIKFNELKNSFRSTLVATNENSVWIFKKYSSSIYANKTGFIGYIWNKAKSVKLLPSIQWRRLCAEGVYDDKGCIWLMSVNGDIFCMSPNYQHFQSIAVPCEDKILCMASTVDTLWVLTEKGRLHSRIGLTERNILGSSWRELKPPQIDNLRLVWVSCRCDVAWACDIHGRTFISIGHNTATTDPAWLEVEGRPKDVHFEKVFVGSQFYMVWAIDSKQNLYVREGIFSSYQIGTSWVYVCGIKATHITISGTSVWALSSEGSIYQRCGVSESNFIGDYWKNVPGTLKTISSSFTDELWGISEEDSILRLSYNLKVLNGAKVDKKNKEVYSSKEDISWEMVE